MNLKQNSYFCIMKPFKTNEELSIFLDDRYFIYNTKSFIENDPISIPHKFSKKEDIEISAFLVSTIAWGQRKTIINNGLKICSLMNNSPFDFIINHKDADLKTFSKFVHRTFNSTDLQYFIIALKEIYLNYGGLEKVFNDGFKNGNAFDAIIYFRSIFLNFEHEKRTEKHISNPNKNSACKRINMFLRWMVRNDNFGVDFGLWNKISPSKLICPLDVHSARVARSLGLLSRIQNDRKAAEELTNNLLLFCAEDPVKYDFALFGAGVNEW